MGKRPASPSAERCLAKRPTGSCDPQSEPVEQASAEKGTDESSRIDDAAGGSLEEACSAGPTEAVQCAEKACNTDPIDFVHIRVRKFDGEILSVDAFPEKKVVDVKAHLCRRLQLDRGVSLKLVSGEQVLDDSMPVTGLSGEDLQLVLTRVPVLLLPTGLSGKAKYRAGGVSAPDGHLFFAPLDASRVLRVDPERLVAECIGPAIPGTDKYEAGGILAGDGCAYFAPRDASRVLQIDCRTASVNTVGPKLDGEDKYLARGVLAPNGCIYFAPSCAPRVLRIKPGALPEDVAVEEVGQVLEGQSKYMAGGVLGEDGRLYFAPCKSQRVLCLEPGVDGDRVCDMEPSLPGNVGDDILGKYVAGGVLGSNGCIYFAPLRAGRVLRVDPARQEVVCIGPLIDRVCAYEAAGVLGPDGLIYFAPYDAAHVLRIDPKAPEGEEVSSMSTLPGSASIRNYTGQGAVALDGCIYFAPGSSPDQVLRINPDTQVVELFGRHLGKVRRQHQRYQSGFVRAQDGRLFAAPHDSEKVLCIQT